MIPAGGLLGSAVPSRAVAQAWPLSSAEAAPESDVVARFEHLTELSNQVAAVALAIIDGQFRYLAVNHRLASLNGISIEAHFGRSIESVVPEAGPLLTQFVATTLQNRRPVQHVQFSARVPFVSGSLRDWLGNFFPIKLAGGGVGVAHTVIEITECTRIEAALSKLLLDTEAPSNREHLTTRENEVLTLIGQGKTTKEIATFLSISTQTVGNHRKQICRRLNMHSTVELAAYAAAHLLSITSVR